MENLNDVADGINNDVAEEQLTVEVPVELRAGLAPDYNCCTRQAQ